MTDEQPSLGQLIWLVRRELEWAYALDANHPLRFEVGTVELDLTVEVTRTTTGGGGLDLKVLGVGASGSLSQERTRGGTSRVHVTLTPRDARTESGKYEVSAEDTEPPPRRAEAFEAPVAPPERPPVPEATGDGQGWAAGDTDSPTGSSAVAGG